LSANEPYPNPFPKREGAVSLFLREWLSKGLLWMSEFLDYIYTKTKVVFGLLEYI